MSDAVAKIELKRDHAGEWRFTAVAGNGEPVTVSEGYARKQSARDEAEKLFPGVPIVEVE